MEYRKWQLDFISWLESLPLGSVVNLCGGSWGKSTLKYLNKDPNVLYYTEDQNLLDQDSFPSLKIVIISLEEMNDFPFSHIYNIENRLAYQDETLYLI